MTISFRWNETEIEVDEAQPSVCLLHGRTPALKMTNACATPQDNPQLSPASLQRLYDDVTVALAKELVPDHSHLVARGLTQRPADSEGEPLMARPRLRGAGPIAHNSKSGCCTRGGGLSDSSPCRWRSRRSSRSSTLILAICHIPGALL